MAQRVEANLYQELDGQLHEIKRQIRQPSGYPYEPEKLKLALQALIEGRFDGIKPLSILETVGTVLVPATTEKFIAKDNFVQNTGKKAKVKISNIGDNFTQWFGGKVEEPVAEYTLRYAKLLKPAVDAPIRAEIGAEYEETTLGAVYSLMKLQPNGEAGILLANGYANIFYVRDVEDTLRTVGVSWCDVGWFGFAGSVTRPGGWDGGDRVFSRNSS